MKYHKVFDVLRGNSEILSHASKF